MPRQLVIYSQPSGNPETAAYADWSEDLTDAMLVPYEQRAAVSMRDMSFDEMLAAVRGEMQTASGIPISADRALRVATVFACVRVIAEDAAKLPRHLMIRDEIDGRHRTQKAVGDPRYALLTSTPNDWMTGQELIEYMVGQAALRGASFAELVRENGSDGPVTEILPLLPGTCRRLQGDDWSISYEVSGYGTGTRILGARDVWCLNGPMFGTLAGADVSHAAREAVGLAQALEGSQARFHANDARPSGILTTKMAIKPEQRDAMRAAWQAAYGIGGRGGVAILGDDFDFKAINVSAADSQLIQNREFQIEEVCRYFRVHPWAVMRQASTQAYASLEQTALAHIQHTMMPWVARVEQTAHRDILDRDPKLYLKVNINALARSTLNDRVNAYKTATGVYMTPNEVRSLEDLDELDDPAMDLVQLPANNTGIQRQPLAAPAATPGRTD